MKRLPSIATGLISCVLISSVSAAHSAPEIKRDKYDDSVRASVRLNNCSLVGEAAAEFSILVHLNSCHFTAASKGGVRIAFLEFVTNNRTWFEMNKLKKNAGIFITTAGGTTRLTQPAEWEGTVSGGSVLESVIINIKPGSKAWNLLKSATKLEAKFERLEYQTLVSPQNRQDIKSAMQAIF